MKAPRIPEVAAWLEDHGYGDGHEHYLVAIHFLKSRVPRGLQSRSPHPRSARFQPPGHLRTSALTDPIYIIHRAA